MPPNPKPFPECSECIFYELGVELNFWCQTLCRGLLHQSPQEPADCDQPHDIGGQDRALLESNPSGPSFQGNGSSGSQAGRPFNTAGQSALS